MHVCSVTVAFIATVAVAVVIDVIVLLYVRSLLEKSILENLCADCAQVLNSDSVPLYLAASHRTLDPSLSLLLPLMYEYKEYEQWMLQCCRLFQPN